MAARTMPKGEEEIRELGIPRVRRKGLLAVHLAYAYVESRVNA